MRPLPLGPNDNAGEVIVEQNDVRSILWRSACLQCPSGSPLRIPQGGSTVGTIASHRYDLAVWEDIYILQHLSLRHLPLSWHV